MSEGASLHPLSVASLGAAPVGTERSRDELPLPRPDQLQVCKQNKCHYCFKTLSVGVIY